MHYSPKCLTMTLFLPLSIVFVNLIISVVREIGLKEEIYKSFILRKARNIALCANSCYESGIFSNSWFQLFIFWYRSNNYRAPS